MAEILLRKLVVIRDRIAKIRHALPARPEEIREDERLEAFVSFHLFLLIQDVVDLASHLVAARNLGVPGSQREVFESLATAGLLSEETARSLGSLTALRNRIAHAYGDLDPVRMVVEAPAGLVQVERLLDELDRTIAQTP